MRTKRYISLLLAALMALSLAACGGDKDKKEEGGMTIAPAQLSEEEQKLAQLLDLGMESHHMFEFEADGAKFLQLNVYELVDGDWKLIQGGGGAELAGSKGRIALTFGKITDGVRLAFQTEQDYAATSYQPIPEDDVSNMAFVTSALDREGAAIELDKEIPLVLQAATSKSEVRMYQVDYFEMPRELAKTGYEHIYAITAVFSAQRLEAAPSVPSAEPPAEPSPEA